MSLASGRPEAHILIVDDDAGLRRVLGQALDAEGYRISSAEHGLEALEHLREALPDLILLDLSMPIMDGWEFLHRLPTLGGREIAVMAISATLTAADTRRLRALGVRLWLSKPFELADLLSRVQSVLAGHASPARR